MGSWLWAFKQYRSASSGRDAITVWRRRLLPARRAALDTFLDRIAKMRTWPSVICSPLKGHSGCWELRWTAEKVEHRIFGKFAGSGLFIMFVGCTHKQRIYDPANALETMDDRKRKLISGEGVLADYGWKQDEGIAGEGIPPRLGNRPN